jgi:hypothetical protein
MLLKHYAEILTGKEDSPSGASKVFRLLRGADTRDILERVVQ